MVSLVVPARPADHSAIHPPVAKLLGKISHKTDESFGGAQRVRRMEDHFNAVEARMNDHLAVCQPLEGHPGVRWLDRLLANRSTVSFSWGCSTCYNYVMSDSFKKDKECSNSSTSKLGICLMQLVSEVRKWQNVFA